MYNLLSYSADLTFSNIITLTKSSLYQSNILDILAAAALISFAEELIKFFVQIFNNAFILVSVKAALFKGGQDLAAQFTDMITTQRGYQANSRVITTSDEILQELVNLKR